MNLGPPLSPEASPTESASPSPSSTECTSPSLFTLPSACPSEIEAIQYYAGLPSSPHLLAHTSTTPWEGPNGPEADVKHKRLGAVFNHKLNTVWEDNVALRIHACLDDMGVKWTSTDVFRIGTVGDSSDPVILWIGVKPNSLASEDAKTAAFRCLRVLEEFDITDVDVELRESSVFRSAGPKLLLPVDSSDVTVDVRHPLTHALGLSISTKATPFAEGTGGIFLAKDSNSSDLLLVTAHHVVFPPSIYPNNKYEYLVMKAVAPWHGRTSPNG